MEIIVTWVQKKLQGLLMRHIRIPSKCLNFYYKTIYVTIVFLLVFVINSN